MERLLVRGGARLSGDASVTGAKNSVLKLMAAALLAEGVTELTNVPRILDVAIMSEVLRRLGCEVVEQPGPAGSGVGGAVRVRVPADLGCAADYDLVRRMRASVAVLGPLLARTGRARVALPGGDAIGSRGLDMHVHGLQRLGALVDSEHGFLVAHAPGGRLRGATIWLDFPSVGATENLLMAAALAEGTTVIDNAAREPEIADLCDFLCQMGGKVEGAGSSTLTVHGVDRLTPVAHRVVPDRIVAGTFAIAAVMTRGDLRVRGARPEHLEIALAKLVDCGALVTGSSDGFRVVMDGPPRAVDVVTLPYPGFPTDLQPMIIAMLALAEGPSMVTENVFDGRWMFVNELTRLGADIRTDGHHAVVRGPRRLSAAPVRTHDIRAGAGLVLAGLVADGVTEISDVHHIDRGYQDLVEQLCRLGADVRRESGPDLPPPG